ncbi:MAG TPA: 2-oxoglutarate dehydrogenase E1 component [Polyangiaceae bacterium]|nr:2-oxoglutarate dehydrogenase E1 component [Polyangiaceae bacterium]
MFEEFGINAGYVEELHTRWLSSPHSVEGDWRRFFEETNGAAAAEIAATIGTAAGVGPGAAGRGGYANGKRTGNGAAGTNNGNNGTYGGPNGTNGTALAANGANGANGHALVAAEEEGVAPPVAYRDAVRETLIAATELQSRVAQLVNAYRVRGHLFADLNPLGKPPPAPELELSHFGLDESDFDKSFSTAGMAGLPERATLHQIVAHLRETYCSSIGVEFTQIEDTEPRQWLQQQMESTKNHASLDRSELIRILTKLTEAEIFEQFIHKNYVGSKRFSLEGAESMIPMIDRLIEAAGQYGIEELVIGMAHRGRLNVLVNVMGKNVREIFAAFDDKKPERFLGTGDVKYHLGYSSEVVTQGGRPLHLSLAFNPSHLEWVNPIVEGRVRAKIDRRKHKSTMPLLVHGDASFMGQGVVAETLNLSQLEGYTTGGTIHLVVNNQIGFTTLPRDSRSTHYCTDVARMLRVPVFHVNGEDPEAVIQVTRLAIEFRQRFKQDVVIDMFCYRKYGHNEGDEPRFTQPQMYALIDKKPTVREVYVSHLVAGEHISYEEADAIAHERRTTLDRALEEARQGDYHTMPETMGGVWTPYQGGPDSKAAEVSTSFPKEKLLAVLDKLATIPSDFHPHPKALKTVEQRRERAAAGQPLDWGAAEHLACASILLEGHGIRFTGQDARRGTFSHRHAVLFDTQTGEPYVPLAHLGDPGSEALAMPGANGGPGSVGRFEIYDSPLSEAGVLGFEYGYSLDRPDKLVVWEAQFGDFANAAQVIIDQFIVSAEDKWSRLSGLVLLLPHGFEGQGPEHSSARIERFLQLAAEDNIQVCNVTTPAQFFHLLRRQVNRNWRKPLVVFTPKSLLRHPEAVSPLDELAHGSFQRVIGDDTVDPGKVRRVLLCSGKVYYDLAAERRKRSNTDIAIVRLEQIYPLSGALGKALAPYREDVPVVWVQEEPRNMGAWYFVNARRETLFGGRPLSLASRAESASPATGSKAAHDLEQKMLLDEAFGE